MEPAPESLLAYAQVRALAGGTTAIQGWPMASRRPANPLVRSVDNDPMGPLRDPVVGLAADPRRRRPARARAAGLRAGPGRSSTTAPRASRARMAAREFDDLATARTACTPASIAVHGSALDAADFGRWRARCGAAGPGEARGHGGVVAVLEPLAVRHDHRRARRAGRAASASALGTDWGPSGTKNLLGELKVARLWSDAPGLGAGRPRPGPHGHGHTRRRARPGVAGRPSAGWCPGRWATSTVLTRRRADVWRTWWPPGTPTWRWWSWAAVPGSGRRALMRAAGDAGATCRCRCGHAPAGSRSCAPTTRPRLDVGRRAGAAGRGPAPTWPSHRPGPAGARRRPRRRRRRGRRPAGAGVGRPARHAAVGPPRHARRPRGRAGPPPAGRTVDIPPIEPLHHDRRWLASLAGRGFHGGVLDGLRGLFR